MCHWIFTYFYPILVDDSDEEETHLLHTNREQRTYNPRTNPTSELRKRPEQSDEDDGEFCIIDGTDVV